MSSFLQTILCHRVCNEISFVLIDNLFIAQVGVNYSLTDSYVRNSILKHALQKTTYSSTIVILDTRAFSLSGWTNECLNCFLQSVFIQFLFYFDINLYYLLVVFIENKHRKFSIKSNRLSTFVYFVNFILLHITDKCNL